MARLRGAGGAWPRFCRFSPGIECDSSALADLWTLVTGVRCNARYTMDLSLWNCIREPRDEKQLGRLVFTGAFIHDRSVTKKRSVFTPATTLTEEELPSIRVMMMPSDTNAMGTIFGGHILSIIDQAGALGAHRLGLRRVVTVAMREVEFRQPVKVGDLVTCYTDVVKIGNTSVTVQVRVVARSPADTQHKIDVTVAEVVYVHVDEHGRSLSLPDSARQYFKEVQARRESRKKPEAE